LTQTDTSKATSPNPRNDEAAEASSAFLPVSPFEIVVFGGTGDLARRKLLPALYHRFCDNQFAENVRILGVSRSDMSREAGLIKRGWRIGARA